MACVVVCARTTLSCQEMEAPLTPLFSLVYYHVLSISNIKAAIKRSTRELYMMTSSYPPPPPPFDFALANTLCCGDEVDAMSAVSSANWLHVVSSLMHALGKSMVYVRKSRGPRTEPWGTPAGIPSQGETVPSTWTRWRRPERYPVSQMWASASTP